MRSLAALLTNRVLGDSGLPNLRGNSASRVFQSVLAESDAHDFGTN
jgi:hypothetical protein